MKLTNLIKRLFLLIIASVIFFNTYSQSCPIGMVSYWQMEEKISTALSDYVSGNTATSNVILVNEPIGIVGNAKIFDGTNYINIPDKSVYNFETNTGFSIELWVKLPLLSSGYQVIIGKNDAQGKGALWYLGIEDGIPFFYIKDTGDFNTRYLTDTTAINDSNWHYIAAVRDGAVNTNFLYVDGKIVDQATFDYPSDFTTSAMITVGYLFNNSSPSYHYTGSLDEIAFYNRALSQSDINTHKAKGISGIGYCDGYGPNIISIPDNRATVGNNYTYTAFATGLPDMKYSLITSPSGMTISPTGIIAWTPDSMNIDALVSVRADNSIPPADTQVYRIFISEGVFCPKDLIVLLKLDETSGPCYADNYGAHNATASVWPTAATGIINGGQTFNATTKMDIPDIASEFDWSSSASFSFECWMKTDTTATMEFMTRHRLDSEKVAFWYVGTDKLFGSFAEFELRDNGGNIKDLISTSAINDNMWHHILAVRDGANKLNKLYVDGEEEASIYVDYAHSFIADKKTEINIGYLHRARDDEPEYHFVGTLDEVAIYNRAVTAVEANLYHNGGLAIDYCAEGNFAPAILSTPITSAIEYEEYSYKLIAFDIDTADVLTYRAVSIAGWLNFSPEDGLLTGIPTDNDTGENNIVINISDGTTSINQEFTITVLGVTAVTEINSNNYLIFPVPVKDELKIKFNNISEETDINIINSTGSIIESIIVHANTELINIPVNHIEAGFYICHIRNNTINATSRFLIIR